MTNPKPTYDVIYAAGHTVIGRATSAAGAKVVYARKIGHGTPSERITATLAERLDDDDKPAGLAWFVGVQLIPKHERERR